MKHTIIALILALTLCGTASAHKEPLVYDQTATISFSATSHDAEGHFTDADGRTADVYCDSTTSSCTETAGAFVITFADGNYTVIGSSDPLVSRCDLLHCQPLLSLMTDAKPHEFHYRKTTMNTSIGKVGYMCVGFDSPDNHGKFLPREACYEIFSLTTKDGLLFPDPKTGNYIPSPAESSKYRMK